MIEWGNEVADAKEVYRHPTRDLWLDEDGDCRLTLEPCDCEPERCSYGCGKCDRAARVHIDNLVKNSVPIPIRKEAVPNGSIDNKTDMWVNPTDTVGIVMGNTYAAIETMWWFKFLQKIPPMSWRLIVRPWECPYGHALMELENWKQPKEVLWAPDLRLILKFANYYYVIATASFESIEEIKRRYGVGNIQITKRVSDNNPMTTSRFATGQEAGTRPQVNAGTFVPGRSTSPVNQSFSRTGSRGPESYVPPAPAVRRIVHR